MNLYFSVWPCWKSIVTRVLPDSTADFCAGVHPPIIATTTVAIKILAAFKLAPFEVVI
jgi:hypothetical protein